MDPRLPIRFPCAVCGTESDQHASWFLAIENRWLDRLKILSWHPVLAVQKNMRSVCGRQHLKALLTHWLTQANLELRADLDRTVPITSESPREVDQGLLSVGRLVGELAVHRESVSRVWTGSPETLECILNALIGGAEPRPPAVTFSVFDVSSEHYRELALH